MQRVVVVGDRGSGKATFLGLLYATQVKSGSALADDFRFHATFESLDEISGVFQGLMSGAFPDSASKEGMRRISFHLDYRKPSSGMFSRLRSRDRESGTALSFQFSTVKNLDEFVSVLRKGSTIADGSLLDVLESDVVVLLVDSSKVATDGNETSPAPMDAVDTDLTELLTAIQRAQMRSNRKSIHPMVLFSKFDSIPPQALEALDLDGTPPGIRDGRGRGRYGQALLRRNLPKVFARLGVKETRGPNFASPVFFFIWVRTETSKQGGRDRIKLRRAGPVGWEPDYSRDEYESFLESLWNLGDRSRA